MAKRLRQFNPSIAAEAEFSKALRGIAKVTGHIVETHLGGFYSIQNYHEMQAALKAYADQIGPWAQRQSVKMLEKVSKSNKNAYQRAANEKLSKKNSKEINKLIKSTVVEGDVGSVARALMHEQVELIKSIPIKAAERVQRLAEEALTGGRRASDIAEALLASPEVSESQAKLIARTEVARANASFTQARAQAVGAQGYIWRTTMDGAERDSHRKMNGKYVEYAKKPTLSDGTTGHAGTFPNCRCYQDVQFSD